MNPLLYLTNQRIKEFVFQSLQSSYTRRGIATEVVEGIVDVLATCRENPETAVHRVYEQVIDMRPLGCFGEKYNSYKRWERPQFLYALMKEYLIGTTVVDVGCGDNSFCKYLVTNVNQNLLCIGTDVLCYPDCYHGSHVDFRLQEPPLQIPVNTHEANCVMFANVLHHIKHEDLNSIVREVIRITSPERNVIVIIEDTWDDKSKPVWEGKDLNTLLFRLTPEERCRAMAIIDWIGTDLATGHLAMSKPFAFKSMETWEQFFLKHGFQIIGSRYLGFPPQKLHLNPQGLLVLRKKP